MAGPSTTEVRIGSVLKRLREHHGLSLRSLAARVGCSASFLSQVEHGQVSPSIASLDKIAAELGVTLSELFHASQPAALAVVRAGERPGFASSWSRARAEALTLQATDRRTLEAIAVTLSPKGASGKRAVGHPNDQFAYVIKGPVSLFVEGGPLALHSGDAVVIPRSSAHRWENSGPESVEVLIVSVRLPR